MASLQGISPNKLSLTLTLKVNLCYKAILSRVNGAKKGYMLES